MIRSGSGPILGIFAVALVPFSLSSWAGPPYESPPVFEASDLMPSEVRKSVVHRVREAVPTTSLLRHYTIDSSFGTFEAYGDVALGETLSEIRAIALLRKIEDLESAGDALGQETGEQVGIIGEFAKHPVETTVAIPKGAFRMIKRVGAAMGQLTDRSQPKTDPIRIYLGTDVVHQEVATRLGVNPYSTNAVLQRELNRVASIASLGNTGIRTLVPWSLATTFADEELVNSRITDLYGIPSTDLYAENKRLLESMGVDGKTSLRLLRDEAFDPVQETLLIRALGRLEGATGIETYVMLSSQALDRIDAACFQYTAELMALHHAGREPVRLVTNVYGYPVFVTASNRLVAPVYGEYAAWTREAEEFCQALKVISETEIGATGIAVYLSGKASERTRRELESLGIELVENAMPSPGSKAAGK